jgi:hypothetical protein
VAQHFRLAGASPLRKQYEVTYTFAANGELFEALGNDPFVIAECLARPVLSERLVADLSAQDKTNDAQSAQTKGLRGMSITTALGNVEYTLPKIPEGTPPCVDDTWTASSTTDVATARIFHTAVWTGVR